MRRHSFEVAPHHRQAGRVCQGSPSHRHDVLRRHSVDLGANLLRTERGEGREREKKKKSEKRDNNRNASGNVPRGTLADLREPSVSCLPQANDPTAPAKASLSLLLVCCCTYLRRLSLPVGEHLPANVFEQNQSRLQVRKDVALEHVPRTAEFLVGDLRFPIMRQRREGGYSPTQTN